MERINFEGIRMAVAATISPILAYFTPTKGFVMALIVMFAFNIWAGMRADGISIKRCHNFRFSKFKNALAELLLYLLIIETINIIMISVGDGDAALIIIKSLTYIFLYVYLQNAFKNLIIAYPKNVALRLVYHIIRLEFTRLLPERWKPIIDHFSELEEQEKAKKDGDKPKND